MRILVAALAVIILSVTLTGGLATAPDSTVSPGFDTDPAQTGPTAVLTVTPNPAHPGQNITLDARNSTVPDGQVAYCEFDVDGDGTYDERVPDCIRTFPFYAAGEYEVRVRVVSGDDRTATATERLVVRENQPPTAEIGVDPTTPRPGETVTLSAAGSTDADGAIATVTWRIGATTRTGERVQTAFEAPGNYTVSVTTTDDDGAQSTVRSVVRVRTNDAPTASLSVATEQPTVGESLRLDATGSTDPDGEVRQFAWDLDGDGTVDRRTTEGTTSFVPAAAGEFEARVTVIDDRNASDTASLAYSVAPAAQSDATDGGSEGATDATGGLVGVVGPGAVPWLLGVLLLALLGGAGLAVRRRETVVGYTVRARDLLMRGDVRRRLAKKVSGVAVKKVAKGIVRRFSDLVETGGELLGNGFEAVGRAIKRGSQRVAAWLRRLGS